MKTSFKDYKSNKWIQMLVVFFISIFLGSGVTLTIKEGEITIQTKSTIELSTEQLPAILDDRTELDVPTIEVIDGGKLMDEYEDLGAIEIFDTSTPEAFKNATLGKCVRANNKYGSQCVSLARSFWWSYANRDVSTCGTGMAKGMMNCAGENAGEDFLILWKENIESIQAGDWLVFDGGEFGHVGMALGSPNNGYVALLGENQGGHSCAGGGASTNIINISLKNFIGGYRPKAYIKPEPKPEPEPIPISKCIEWGVKRGDTMSKIMLECEGTIVYGEPMNDYAKTWYSTIIKPNQSVYEGWVSPSGVGLYAGDLIEHRIGN